MSLAFPSCDLELKLGYHLCSPKILSVKGGNHLTEKMNVYIVKENYMVKKSREMIWDGRWEGGSGLGTHVHPWLIHVNVWQNHYSIVKQNKVKIKIKMN